MLGFRINGYILAGLASAIYTLEHQSPSQKIRDIGQALEYHGCLFRNTVELLLGELLPRSEIQDLLANPTSSKWENDEINIALKAYFGPDGYDSLFMTAYELLEAVRTLQSTLRNTTARVGSEGYKLLIRGYILKPAVRDVVNMVDQQNQKLRRFIDHLSKTHGRSPMNVERIEEKFRIPANNTTHGSNTPLGTDDDFRSLYTVESEASSEGTSLSYLTLSLQEVNRSEESLEEALLDTGATACAISTNMALKLNLNVKDTEKTVVKTAALNEELRVVGRVHLNLRWKDNEEKRFGTRMWVYVVYGMSQPMLLSHGFMLRHPEMWKIAKTVIHRPRQLNVLWFNKLTEKQKKAEEACHAQCLLRNMAMVHAEEQKRRSEQDRLLASPAQSSTSKPSAASTSGSTQDPTSNSGLPLMRDPLPLPLPLPLGNDSSVVSMSFQGFFLDSFILS
ncbi:hypothetical protein F5Y02DRAFT_413503 [Annulohypoxylon stygium]|nr:hypothetical protein F5Y02DRAFT_413503 [Annulohypoxylon stygium]